MNPILKRSNAPIFWLLFGAGGVLSALLGPILIFITGIAVPLGLVFSPDAMSYANMKIFAQDVISALFMWGIVSLFLWHAGHRMFHSLHDLGIRTGSLAKLICYGIPLVATIMAATALLT